ncbi:hypothetical protein BSL78_21978 [Apostichopus japonicus]|uniref:HYR domain-containing protein n=1 Tax=Stichopus japonicus TaxID=307972 RepID=A0A2G8JZL7_STIJA|nr:hypothetical protein BSL78_21978 [Apostichopus japonicus]
MEGGEGKGREGREGRGMGGDWIYGYNTMPLFVSLPVDPDVLIIDNCPPPEVPEDDIALRSTAPQDQEFATVIWTEPTARTGNPQRTSNRAPGDDFFIGSTYVLYEFENPANSATTECAFYVIVSRFADTEAPTVTCPSDLRVLGAFNVPTTEVTWDTVPPVDNVGVQDFRFIPASGSLFGIGVTTVNFNAVDAAGNEGKCEFTVTVVENNDINDPVIENCPTDFTFFTTSGQQRPQITWSLPTVFDDNQWTLMASMDPPVFLEVRPTPTR